MSRFRNHLLSGVSANVLASLYVAECMARVRLKLRAARGDTAAAIELFDSADD